ncbi:MAG: flagellar motor switch protein FliG [Rhodosalinus sp.]
MQPGTPTAPTSPAGPLREARALHAQAVAAHADDLLARACLGHCLVDTGDIAAAETPLAGLQARGGTGGRAERTQRGALERGCGYGGWHSAILHAWVLSGGDCLWIAKPMDRHPQLAPPGLPATAQATVAAAGLTRRQKAAIIVRLLLTEGADLPLADLPEPLQAELTATMGRLRYVDQTTLAQVVREFLDELESVGMAFPGGMAGALALLDGRISRHTAERIRREAGVRQMGDPWGRLRALPVEDLLPFATEESTEVAAVLLSKLDVAKAATLLGKLPGERARRITYAVSLTGGITPEAVERIGVSLAAQLDARPARAFDEEPVKRVGAILDFSRAVTRDEVLEGLEQTDSAFAARVRRAIFTFADIPARLDGRDVPKVLRSVDQPVLVTALAGAAAAGLGEPAAFLLSSLPSRLSGTLREEMEALGNPDPREVESAMAEVVAAIRRMEAARQITLATPPAPDTS